MSISTDSKARVVTAWNHVRAILMLPAMNTILIPALLVWQLDDVGSLQLGQLGNAAQLLSITFLCAGAALVVRAIQLFVRKGEGTLAPWDPTQQLITTGIYRFSRNPMKSGLFLILIGETLLLQSFALAVWTGAFIAANVCYIRWSEEPGLRKRFGQDYDAYCRRVPRWLGFARTARRANGPVGQS